MTAVPHRAAARIKRPDHMRQMRAAARRPEEFILQAPEARTVVYSDHVTALSPDVSAVEAGAVRPHAPGTRFGSWAVRRGVNLFAPELLCS